MVNLSRHDWEYVGKDFGLVLYEIFNAPQNQS